MDKYDRALQLHHVGVIINTPEVFLKAFSRLTASCNSVIATSVP
ncbi:MAG: hypothetical protein JWP78_3949 [Mucilaginibacter sp.]|nr:hypothetical protein [Mucilaginibacter sp.]